MADSQDYLSGANIGFIEALYARWLEAPGSVDESWREVFSKLAREGRPLFPALTEGEAAPKAPSPAAAPAAMVLQARVAQVLYAYRLRGHLMAKLDPLELAHASPDRLELGLLTAADFTADELATPVDPGGVYEQGPVTLATLLGRLSRTYCRHVGAESMQVQEGPARHWLQECMEWAENRPPFAPDERLRLLSRLADAQAFETVAHTRFVGTKRFSLEGGEALIPMLDALLETGGALGVDEVVVGMAHRGRLNVLTNVMGKPPYEMFSEFLGPADVRPYLGRGDVKYHLGFSSDFTTRQGKRLHLSLAFNPSHLEAVYPVVEGRVRAKQDRAGDATGARCLPLVLHGDASFIAQGVVSETLNLAGLSAYRTGGTVHVVVDNQVGFTTEADQGRSTRYCTAIARQLGIPIFHVNGDDPEACVHVMRLAVEYRQRFHSDVVVDLVCYRRWGHNEGDEPSFTQPLMYERIRTHAPVRELYAGRLMADGLLSADVAEQGWQAARERFQTEQERAKQAPRVVEPSFNQGLWQNYRGGPDRDVPEADTAVARERLAEVALKLSQVPQGFTPHPKVVRLLEQRREMSEGKRALDWGMAELLALGTLLRDGHSVRLTGQDSERGTFSQRHAVLHDARTGAKHCALCDLSPVQGDCLVANAPLSEEGCLGFEAGYAYDFPDALVAWEAQYGDFANSAQVVIDQYIAAAEDKWRRLSGLTLLLPHGFEGQGAEHSSARLERFLQLCAEDNLQVCVPTTPAQHFHLLRRQVLRAWRKPLVVMTPKSLLRLPAATSSLDALCAGRFERVLPDAKVDAKEVTRLLLCSGRVFYELAGARDAKKDSQLAIVRLEQLYPFPAEAVAALFKSMPRLTELFWVQDEPKNSGAWRFVAEQLQELPGAPRARYVGRPESASPATGFHGAHELEQHLIIDEATTRGSANGR
jgi:2-oxoglutarate dehydrogenase E1 component